MYNAAKALNLNINESEIKKCFEKYNEEIDFEKFKKLILDSENEDKNIKEGFNRDAMQRTSSRRNNKHNLKETK